MNRLTSNTNLLFAFAAIVAVLSCGKDEELVYSNLNGTPYPKGIKVIDLAGLNDCTLSSCSESRITRLELNDAIGTFRSDSIINVSFTFDSKIQFHICNISSAFEIVKLKDGDRVMFSGTAKDGCGYLSPSFPFEEKYFIHLTEIEKL